MTKTTKKFAVGALSAAMAVTMLQVTPAMAKTRPVRPGAVQTVSVKDLKPQYVKASWKKASRATSYKVYYKVGGSWKAKSTKGTSASIKTGYGKKVSVKVRSYRGKSAGYTSSTISFRSKYKTGQAYACWSEFSLDAGESRSAAPDIKKGWSGNTPSYSVEDSSIAAVSSSGKVTGVAPGKTVVHIKLGSWTGETVVTVKGTAGDKNKDNENVSGSESSTSGNTSNTSGSNSGDTSSSSASGNVSGGGSTSGNTSGSSTSGGTNTSSGSSSGSISSGGSTSSGSGSTSGNVSGGSTSGGSSTSSGSGGGSSSGSGSSASGSSTGISYIYENIYFDASLTRIPFKDTAAMRARVEELKKEEGITDNSSDLEKAKAAGHWMCYHVNYAYNALKAGTSSDCDPEHILTNDNFHTVCSGYARTYNYILQKLGVPVRNISYAAGDHEWNQVQINGNWYNVDVTGMDGIGQDEMPNHAIEITWGVFMKSTAKLYSYDLPMYRYYDDPSLSQLRADDTTYDNYTWS